MSWTFEVPQDSMSKCGAWLRCVRSGLRVGIPQHAWRREHDNISWRWTSVTPEQADAHAEYLRSKGVKI